MFYWLAIASRWDGSSTYRGVSLQKSRKSGRLDEIVFKIKEDDARNPGVIADLLRQCRRSVGTSADGFETYGVTGVALITFIRWVSAAQRCRFSYWCGSSSLRIMIDYCQQRVLTLLTTLLPRRASGIRPVMNFESP